jgi:gamma-glutamylcyclotransferase (GGCT)/AIG2-like uncharacterized protein YtfP
VKEPAATARAYKFYFAYGSNMAAERMTRRIPAAEIFCAAKLAAYSLQFHKVGSDGSGKCDVVQCDSPGAAVYGVLFRVQQHDLLELDRYEGPGYSRTTVTVATDSGEILAAATYVALKSNPQLLPYSWYKEHVLRGATVAGLPASYIATLKSVECVEDPDRARHMRELAIYGE